MDGDLPAAFDHRHYVPILLTRQGERLALRETPDSVKENFTPLFVGHPIDRDLDTGLPKRSVNDHVNKLVGQLLTDWGTRPAFIDLCHFDPTQRMDDGSHPLAAAVSAAADGGLTLAPVLNDPFDGNTREAALACLPDDGTLCLRLSPEAWADLGTVTGDGRLLALLAEVGLPPGRIHLVLDGGELAPAVPLTAAAMRAALTNLPHAQDWRSVTVAGTGMPSGTAEAVGADNSEELPRVEWRVWRTLNDGSPSHRRPTFGDYGVQHPDPVSNFDPRFMDSSAQLRYTIPSSWLVVRGRGVKAKGNQQIRGLAAKVVSHPQFAGRGFSWGDAWLDDCASGTCNPGNQSVWRKVTTNHHLAHVVSQVAILLGT